MNFTTELIEELVQKVVAMLPDKATMTDIEKQTKSLMNDIGNQVVKQAVEAETNRYAEPLLPCSCGGEANHKWKRSGHFHTIYGKIVIKRDYYLCPSCHCGFYPLDNRLGLRPNQLSAELSRLVAMTGVEIPFMAGRNLFEELTGISVSDQTMGKATQAVGRQVVADEIEWQEKGMDKPFLLKQKREQQHPLRLYGSIDATKVHIRDDQEHRWRDLKIGAFYEARGRPPSTPDGQWGIKAEKMHYFADIAPAREFSSLVWGHGVKKNAQLAKELIFVCDGAEWIWNIIDDHFPSAIQILDWFHASEYLMPVAQAIYSETHKQAKWVAETKALLWAGKVETILERLDLLRETHSDDVIRTTANYFENHKERMRYEQFRKNGYQIGSGTIESAAKQIGMMRLKVPGAIWNESSARLVAKARAAFLSDRWESLPFAT